MRRCPFTGCKARIRHDKFCCAPHWRTLNRGEQAYAYELFAKWKDNTIDGHKRHEEERLIVRVAEERMRPIDLNPATYQ